MTCLRCRNGSFEPVYDVCLKLALGSGVSATKSMGVMKPMEELEVPFEIGPGPDSEPRVELMF